MLKVSNVLVSGLEESVIASSYALREEELDYDKEKESFEHHLERAKRLARLGGGSGHSNFRTGINVSFDVTYPQYWSMEAQRYHWFQIITSMSKMHRLNKLDIDKCCNKYVSPEMKHYVRSLVSVYNVSPTYENWMRLISNCPLGLELTMRVSTNYEQLATIYKQRKDHRLKEDWGAFCEFIESLPFAKELIINEKE